MNGTKTFPKQISLSKILGPCPEPLFIQQAEKKPAPAVAFTIIVDTREQLPYLFKSYPVSVLRNGLKSGDYSIQGYENSIAVERKSKADLYSSLGSGRKRFEREFQRLSEFDYAALVIEDTLGGLLVPPERSQMNYRSVVNSLISWGIRYGVQVFTADTRSLAECLVYRIFEKFLKNKGGK